MSEQLSFNIELPVAVGLQQLQKITPKQEKCCSLDFKVTLKLGNILDQLKDNLHCVHLSPKSIHTEYNAITLSCFQTSKNKGPHQLCVDFKPNQYQCDHCFCLIPKLVCNITKGKCIIQVRRKVVNLIFTVVQKARFINNDTLKNAMLENQDWGMVSMDQTGRILLDGKKSNFPVIGIWEKSNKDIQHIDNYLRVCKYLSTTYAAKCKFYYQNQNFIYYVKISPNQSIPILHLIQYQISNSVSTQQNYQTINHHSVTIINEPLHPEQSGMQFTLRDKHKERDTQTTDRTISYLSPIKYLDNDIMDLDEKNRHSPQFNGSQKQKIEGIYEDQCMFLRQRVRYQEGQINFLKGQVSRLQNELKFAQTYKLTSPPLDGRKYLFAQETNLSSAKIIRKLAESDLKTNSASTKGKSSRTSNQNSKPISHCLIEEEDPWDYIQIVEE